MGYGGTASEMYRLLQRAAELDEAFAKTANFSIDSKGTLKAEFSDITQAIHIIQDEMGITGTTADEAGRTISGAVSSMKSAWTNLVTGFADGSADIGGLIDNLVTTIVGDGTEINLGVIGNVLPAVERALGGIVQLIAGAAPEIIKILPGLVDQVVPSLITAATGMVNAVIAVLPSLLETVVTALIENAPLLIEASISLVETLIAGIQENHQLVVDSALGIVNQLLTGFLIMLPEIISLGLELLVALVEGISENLPILIPAAVEAVIQIVKTLTNPTTLKRLFEGAMAIISQLNLGLIKEIPNLVDAAIEIINNLLDFIIDPTNLDTLLDSGIEIIEELIFAILDNLPRLLEAAIEIINSLVQYILEPDTLAKIFEAATKIIVELALGLTAAGFEVIDAVLLLIEDLVETFTETDWKSIGSDIVDGVLRGLKDAWENLSSWFSESWDNLVGDVKDFLEIRSPSRVFAGIGKNMALGLGEGWGDEFDGIKNNIEKSIDFDDVTIDVKRNGVGKLRYDNSYNDRYNRGVSIVQNIYSTAKTAADLMEEALYQQERAVFLGV